MTHFTYADINSLTTRLAVKLINSTKLDDYESVYGVPRGGVIPALLLAQEMDLPLVDTPTAKTLIVDDICDSGATLKRFPHHDTAVLVTKNDTPTYFAERANDWVHFPWEGPADEPETIEDNVRRLLQVIGEDPTRDGLLETPKRVAKSFAELYSGYSLKPAECVKVFDCESYTGMVLLKDIELYSMCEHHMLPFVGRCHIAYIPNKQVIGISKLARIMEIYARRLQIQERLTDEIANSLQALLNPKGVAVMIEAEHFCMRMRGVGKQNSTMVTSSLRGCFLDQPEVRSEFLGLIR